MKRKTFVLGKAPDKKLGITGELSHPKKPGRTVRFVKDVRTSALYMNVRDFIQPYKCNKHRVIFKKIIPNRKLNEMWILLDVMEAIIKASKKPQSITKCIEEVRVGELF